MSTAEPQVRYTEQANMIISRCVWGLGQTQQGFCTSSLICPAAENILTHNISQAFYKHQPSVQIERRKYISSNILTIHYVNKKAATNLTKPTGYLWILIHKTIT